MDGTPKERCDIMSEKLRVGGMTIDSTKTYPGKVVLRLLHTSFDNGCRHETVRAEKEFQKGYSYRGNVVRFSMVKVAN